MLGGAGEKGEDGYNAGVMSQDTDYTSFLLSLLLNFCFITFWKHLKAEVRETIKERTKVSDDATGRKGAQTGVVSDEGQWEHSIQMGEVRTQSKKKKKSFSLFLSQ